MTFGDFEREASLHAPAYAPHLASLLGVENEYEVRSGERAVDIRTFIDRLAASSSAPLFRQNAGTFHFSDGLKLTSDGWYAELVTPPEPSSPVAAAAVAAEALHGQNRLLALLARRHTLHGHSTHLNIEIPPGICAPGLARRIALEFGPVLIFLTGRPEGGGIFVRPRPGRLEIASEFIGDPETLKLCLVFLMGALPSALRREMRTPSLDMPSLPGNALIPASVRSGWQLTPPAVSADFERKKRKAVLTSADGRNVTFQEWMDAAWAAIEPELAGRASDNDVRALERLLSGRKKMDFEKPSAGRKPLKTVAIKAPRGKAPRWYAQALKSRSVGGWKLSPAHVQWDFVLMKAARDGRAFYLNVPFRYLEPYGRGRWDGAIRRALKKIPAKKTVPLKILVHTQEAQAPAFFSGFDATGIEDSVGQIPASAKKKKKKKPEEPLCAVIPDKDGIKIVIPETSDPQKLRINKEWEAPQEPVTVGDGISVTNGGVEHHHLDHRVQSLGFDFAFVRNHKSIVDYNGILGQGWDHSYNIRVVPHRPPVYRNVKGGWIELFTPTEPSGNLSYYHGTGRVSEHTFQKWARQKLRWAGDVAGQMVSFEAVVTRYAQNPGEDFEVQRFAVVQVISGSLPACLNNDPIFYRIRHRGGNRMLLNCHGHVVEIRDKNFNRMTFQYGMPLDPGTKYMTLAQAQDTVGRAYGFKYEIGGDGQPRLKKITDPFAREVEFTYDGSYQLSTAKLVRPDLSKPDTPKVRPTVTYEYRTPGDPGFIAAVKNPVETDSGGPAYLKNIYDGKDRVIQQRLGIGTFDITYPAADRVVVNDRASVDWIYTVDKDKVVGLTVNDRVYKNGQKVSIDLKTTYDHDSNYHVKEITHPGGRREVFKYRNSNPSILMGDERDAVGITHHVSLASSDLLSHVVYEAGGAKSFASRFDYELLFNSLMEENSPAGKTKYKFDHGWSAKPAQNGNPLEIRRPPQLNPDGSSLDVLEKYQYGPGGKPVYFRDADRVVRRTTWSFDGQLATESVGGLQIEKNDYDLRGNLTERTDDRNNVWKHDRTDDRGRCLHLKDPLNHEEERTYDLNDRIKTTVQTMKDDPSGIAITAAPAIKITTAFEYTLLGLRTKMTETATPPTPTVPASRVHERRYDAEGRVTHEISPRQGDAQVTFDYNKRGLEKERMEAAGGTNPGTTQTFYDEAGAPALVIDPANRQTTRAYDGFGRVELETCPDGTELHREYSGTELKREYALGPVSPSMNAAAKTRVLRESYFAFDNSQRLIFKRDKAFESWQRANINQSVPAANVDTKTWHTAAGRLWKKQDSAGRVIEYEYDQQGRLSRVTMPGGHFSDHLYGGLLASAIMTTFKPDDPNVGSPPYADIFIAEQRLYDRLGRVIFADNGQGVLTQYAYDSFGNKRAEENGVAKNIYSYDHFSRNIKHTIENVKSASNTGGTIDLAYAYDLNDNKVSATDHRGRTTVVGYDGRDLVTSLAPPLMDALTLDRHPDGLVKKLTRGTGAGAGTTDYHYDPTGRPDIITFRRGGQAVQHRFGYDGAGRVTWAADSNDLPSGEYVEVRRAYDSVGRLLSERTLATYLSHDQTVRTRYSDDQLERKLFYPGLSAPITYKYGPDGNVKEILEFSSVFLKRWHQGPGRVLRTDRRINVHVRPPAAQSFDLGLTEMRGYDSYGRLDYRGLFILDTMNQPSQPTFLPFGKSEQFQFGAGGRLAGRTGAAPADTFAYEYDGQGRLKKTTQGQGPDTDELAYNWDGFNRLYTLEKTKNRAGAAPVKNTEISVRYRDNVRTRTDDFPTNSIVWTFDSSGQLQSASEYLGHTLPTTGSSREFIYDPAGRLKRLNVKSAPGWGSTHSEPEFIYDAFGRLVAHIRGKASTSFLSRERTLFLYDDSSCILEFDQANQQIQRYVYDENRQLIETRYSDPAANLVRETLPVTHIDGGPWMLIQRRVELLTLPPLPGASATAADKEQYFRERLPILMEERVSPPFEPEMILRYQYTASGMTINPAPNSLSPIGPDGLRTFEEEQLLYNHRRFYDPTLRAFISPDPMGAWGDPSALGNPHSSAGNNPAMNGDDGNFIFLLLGLMLLGAALGALISTIRQGIQISEGKRPQGFQKSEVLEGALTGMVLMPALVFMPELVLPVMAIGLGHTGYQLAIGQIGWRTALFDVALMGLPFASAKGRAGLRATLGKGTYIGKARGLGEPFTISERAVEFNTVSRSLSQSARTCWSRGISAGVRYFRTSRLRLGDLTSHTESIPEEPKIIGILCTWPVQKPLDIKFDVPSEFTGHIHGHLSEGQHRAVAWMMKLGPDIRLADLPYGMWREIPMEGRNLGPEISLMLFNRMRGMPRMSRFYTDFQTWLGKSNTQFEGL